LVTYTHTHKDRHGHMLDLGDACEERTAIERKGAQRTGGVGGK